MNERETDRETERQRERETEREITESRHTVLDICKFIWSLSVAKMLNEREEHCQFKYPSLTSMRQQPSGETPKRQAT